MHAGGAERLGEHLAMLAGAGVPLVHVDVMDGRFWPLQRGGADAVAALDTPLLKDVHLMVDAPLDQLPAYARAGADVVTVHLEALDDPGAALRAIGALENANDPRRPVRRGLAVLPSTPVDAAADWLDLVDLLLVLGVGPDRPGRDPHAHDRLARAADLTRGRDGVLVGFDGGVTPGEVGALAALGADLVVTGTAVFSDERPPADVIAAMHGQLA